MENIWAQVERMEPDTLLTTRSTITRIWRVNELKLEEKVDRDSGEITRKIYVHRPNAKKQPQNDHIRLYRDAFTVKDDYNLSLKEVYLFYRLCTLLDWQSNAVVTTDKYPATLAEVANYVKEDYRNFIRLLSSLENKGLVQVEKSRFGKMIIIPKRFVQKGKGDNF